MFNKKKKPEKAAEIQNLEGVFGVAGNGVLVEILTEETNKITQSGIHIPDSAKQQFALAKVIALGKDCDPDLKIGSRVMFLPMSGTTPLELSSGHVIKKLRDIDLLYWVKDESAGIKPIIVASSKAKRGDDDW